MSRILRTEERITRILLALALMAMLFALTLLAARPAHAAEFSVDSTADTDTRACTAAASNDCTLRGAINRSNASTNEDDTISFDIPASVCNASGVCTISPETQLPSLTDKVTIDGYTQDGASENNEDDNTNNAVLKIELNGEVASGGISLTPGLVVNGPGASGTVIRGLVINRFSLHGLFIDAGATATVEGNFIGTDLTGTLDNVGNGFDGVLATSSNNRIGGAANGAQNVISGNGRDGVSLAGTEATDNVIINNHIGTDADAIDPLGNTRHGVAVFSADTVVGGNDKNSANGAGDDDGTAQGEGNIISGNGGHGILVDNIFAEGTKIQGNHIGVDRNGSGNDLGNTLDGVRVSSAPQVEIGGTTDGLGNTISKNGQHGMEIVGTSSTFVKVQGNRIGTNYIGRADRGNGNDGVRLDNVSNTTVGGANAGARNLISGNDANGVSISGTSSATNNTIEGNFIGTDVSGADALVGNSQSGVRVETSGNFIGSDANGFNDASEGNTIAFNTQQGVIVVATATGNRILRNSIFDNGVPNGLGIDLNDDGVTNNDPRDPDTGPNNLQNFPDLSSATVSPGGQVTITGNLNSNPSTLIRKKKKKGKKKKKRLIPQVYTIQFFSNPAPNFPTLFGEGQTFIGEATVVTNTAGNAPINLSFTPERTVLAGEFITATATRNATGDTSEFSAAREVQ